MGVASCRAGLCARARGSSSDNFFPRWHHVPLAVLMMNTNLMLDSDVDDPVVEDNMVDDGLFVGLFHCQYLFWMSMIHRASLP